MTVRKVVGGFSDLKTHLVHVFCAMNLHNLFGYYEVSGKTIKKGTETEILIRVSIMDAIYFDENGRWRLPREVRTCAISCGEQPIHPIGAQGNMPKLAKVQCAGPRAGSASASVAKRETEFLLEIGRTLTRRRYS